MTEKNLIFDCEGIRVVMTHIGGYPGKYNRNALELIQKYNPKSIYMRSFSYIKSYTRQKV